ncbi:hypothetical protein [Streptomyces lincolnensis]|uniref:hypothetical protein n=1 Tax=Streptomyces lincolnensis TaxID=1915 RepID=UPI00082EF31B|nr:hypothetical protein [Streptomyces lincolnensis]QMV09309.1 hypothetical protein GJU35_29130 [Streptomyces lincolnensis]
MKSGITAFILTALIGVGGWMWLDRDDAGGGRKESAAKGVTGAKGVNGSRTFEDWKAGVQRLSLSADGHRERSALEDGHVYVVTLTCEGTRGLVVAGIGEMPMGVPLKCDDGAKEVELHGVTSEAVGPRADLVLRLPRGAATDVRLGWHVVSEGRLPGR